MQLVHPKVAQPKLEAFRPRVCHWFRYLSGTNARQSAEKPLLKAKADRAIFDERPTRQTSVARGLSLSGSGFRAVAQMRLVAPKMPRASSAFS